MLLLKQEVPKLILGIHCRVGENLLTGAETSGFFGIQREPVDFMEQACKVQHPMSPSLALPEVLAEAISFTTQQGFHQVAKRRVEFFKLWNNRAMELEKAEADLRREMDPLVEKAVRGRSSSFLVRCWTTINILTLGWWMSCVLERT